jgi:hypothetical protein
VFLERERRELYFPGHASAEDEAMRDLEIEHFQDLLALVLFLLDQIGH